VTEQMLDARTEQSAAVRARRRLGSGTVFAALFLGLLALLLARNTGVFTLRVAERGDAAANSLLVVQAKHFQLLVGNYSRVGFSHPGPAFFYIGAFGEWLGYDVLGVLPSPYNGQWLATIVLNAALVAAALTVLWSWSRSWRALLWCVAVTLVVVGTHNYVLSSTWMPFVYFAPFLLFLVAAASVAAGRTRDLWLFVLAGGLLVHGHAEFLLLFVPAIGIAALAALGYGRWRRRAGTPFVAWHWLAAAVVLAAFLLPMVLNLVLHWPSEFHKYLTYSGNHASPPGGRAKLRYLLWFWYPQTAVAAVLILALFAGGAVVVRRQPDGELRRFLTAGVGVGALTSVLFAGYVARGVDALQGYIGYFFWAVPLALMLFVATGLESLATRPGQDRGSLRAWRPGTVLPAVALAGALAFAGVSPSLTATPEQLREGPAAIRELAAYAAGRPAILRLNHEAWPQMTALLLDGERAGQRVCVRDKAWRFMVTSQYICTRQEIADGVPVIMTSQPGTGTVAVTFGDRSLSLLNRPN
jgi:hypothetical protein